MRKTGCFQKHLTHSTSGQNTVPCSNRGKSGLEMPSECRMSVYMIASFDVPLQNHSEKQKQWDIEKNPDVCCFPFEIKFCVI
jgi:hypothetical protein